MIWWLICIVLLYAILIVSLAIGFGKVTNFKTDITNPKTTFSVIVPFRNEAENLPFLLKSIHKLKYPKELVEFLFVDDDSSDDSVEVINNHRNPDRLSKPDISILKNIRSSDSPKKDAISIAIQQAKNDWIITTDADCILPEKWLQTFDHFIQVHHPKMIVAPVTYQIENTFFDRFQILDFLSLQGATIGGFGIGKPFLCNGANLAYEKEQFIQLHGFKGNDHIASGDDIFLFEKFVRSYPKQVQFLRSKEVIVKTFPVKTQKELINQRVRWAAKSGNYNLWFAKLVGLIVFIKNLSIIIAVFLAVFQQIPFVNLIVLFLFKYSIDFILMYKSASFFNQTTYLKSFFSGSLLYPFFSVFVVFKSIFSSYQWKERNFKK